MLSFRPPELHDAERVREMLARSDFRGCEYTFGNVFMWSAHYGTEICLTEDFCFEKLGGGSETRFIFPSGSGTVREAVETMLEYASQNGLPTVICANAAIKEEILSLYPEASAEEYRDFFDYVYSARDLTELSGRKYHGKRNHLHRFYENEWSYEPLRAANIPECAAVCERWREESMSDGADELKSKTAELAVVKRSLELFDELGYVGGLLRVDGEAQAFTFGEPSSRDTFVVHVEKALRKYQGAYAAINREFVKSLGGRYAYIDREDDAGSDDLRKAKLSYYPAFMEEKFLITFK